LTISFTVPTVTVLRIQNPLHSISPNGELKLQVRMGDSDTSRWKHLVEQVSYHSIVAA